MELQKRDRCTQSSEIDDFLDKKVRRGSASHTGKSMLLIIEVILRLNIAVALKSITVITMVIFKLTRCVNETLTYAL